MSDERLDALAETARNRGLKLIRSRTRTVGKQGFGKAGLTTSGGKPVFGFDEKGPVASADAIEEYLRTLEAQDWNASLTAPRTSSRVTGSRRSNGPREKPVGIALKGHRNKAGKTAAPRPAKPQVRQARPGDAARLAELIVELGHEIETRQVKKNLSALAATGEMPFVATLAGRIVGLCGVSRLLVVARPAPLGRITSLIVTANAHGQGIGRMLVEAAEEWMRQQGCALVEVTSNDKRAEAHAFYRHMGFERTSIRFSKNL